MLVLGLASAANAALVLSINGSTDISEITIEVTTNFTIDVYSPIAFVDQAVVFVDGPASHTGAGTVYTPPAPSTLVATDYGVFGEYDHAFGLAMSSPVTIAGVGTWWDIVFHCDGTGDVTIELHDNTGANLIDSAVVHQVPEPMTIALLGLGGLFLRRRK